jgi:flavin reductase (DIM6/NTAB) family NADH-FMN oxidoreductase RutF
MAGVPTCVAVICYEHENFILGCTISSFTSISVSENFERILFILRFDSTTGKNISVIDCFTINILSEEQADIARFLGSRKSPHDVNSYLREGRIERNRKSFSIAGAVSYCEVSVDREIQENDSTIYICKVIEFNESKESALIPIAYYNRMFTKLEEI